MSNQIIPSLYVKQVEEGISKPVLRLTTAKNKQIVRFTGGCGAMSMADARGLYQLFIEAFEGFQGAILFGGTRMLRKSNHEEVVPGITEIPALIRENCSDSIILGVVPKSGDLRLDCKRGIIVSEEEGNNFFTIIHPNQDQCLIIQQSADKGVDWTAEYKECIKITKDLSSYANFKSLLISYNGGGVTEKEILDTAELGWPVLLIKDSGRKTEQYANDEVFLNMYPNVIVAEKSVESIREKLIGLDIIKPQFNVSTYRKVAS